MERKFKWFFRRMKLMSFTEVLRFRIPQQLQHKIKGRIQQYRRYPIPEPSATFNFPEYDRVEVTALFDKSPLTPSFPLFDIEVDLEKITNWRKDLKHNISSSIRYYDTIHRQDFLKVGDVKYTAEISRFYFLPFYCLQYYATEDGKYADRVYKFISDWNIQNPYLRSIHWTSGIEVAIRSVNLVLGYLVLSAGKLVMEELKTAMLNQLTYNYHYLKNHLSGYSSANNHLMAELMGLVVISSVFDIDEKRRVRWTNQFFSEVLGQVNEDGVHMELSTRYHAEVTEQILITIEFLKRSGQLIPDLVYDRFNKMFEFVHHTYFQGIPSAFGDDDNGHVIYPYFEKEYCLYPSLLKSGNFLNSGKFSVDEGADFRNLLLLGSTLQTDTTPVIYRDTLFRDSGYCFLYDQQIGLKISFDTGTIGDHITAAHGHSDLLHFTVQLAGKPFIVDSGTYQYHSRCSLWRDYFRGISAHNCISIDGRHHAEMNNRMSWLGRPEVEVVNFEVHPDFSVCTARHKAYEDLGIQISRTLKLDRFKKTLEISDEIIKVSKTTNLLSFYLHFYPDVHPTISGDLLILETEGVRMTLQGEAIENSRLIKGDHTTPLGWYSPTYGIKLETNTLLMELPIKSGKTMTTTLTYL